MLYMKLIKKLIFYFVFTVPIIGLSPQVANANPIFPVMKKISLLLVILVSLYNSVCIGNNISYQSYPGDDSLKIVEKVYLHIDRDCYIQVTTSGSKHISLMLQTGYFPIIAITCMLN